MNSSSSIETSRNPNHILPDKDKKRAVIANNKNRQGSSRKNGAFKTDEAKQPANENHAVHQEVKFHTAISPDNGHSHESDEARKETEFRFEAPSAKKVLLAADFTGWAQAPIQMIKGGGGVWHVKVPLTPGRHLYRFMVDDVWQNDPRCHQQIPNSFGTFNDVVEIS